MIATDLLSLDLLLERIRPSVRAEHAYRVGLDPHIDIKLNQNENPYDVPLALKQRLAEKLIEIPWNRYPNDQPVELQAALADYLGVDPAAILISNGSNEMMMTLGAVLIQAGAPVVLPTPMFSLYEKIVRIQDGNLISVPAKADFSFDVEAILEAIHTHNPALTVIGAPNNPTGATLSKTDQRRILEAAEGFVLIDEAYVDFVDDGRGMIDALADHPNLLLLRTFSKSFGLAGVRLGYLLAHPAVATEILKYRIPFMVDRVTELTGCVMLENVAWMQETVAEIKDEIQKIYHALQRIDGVVQVLPTEANFLLFKTILTGKELMDRMSAQGILLRNMGGYQELKDMIRVNAGTPAENEAFLTALKNVLSPS